MAETTCIWPECQAPKSAKIDRVHLCDRHAIQVYRAVHSVISPNDEPIKHRTTGPRFFTTTTPGTVYFLKLGDRIKIGHTTDLHQRMGQIPHEELLADIPGTVQDERRQHARWAHLRTAGEWFKAEPELLDYIAAL